MAVVLVVDDDEDLRDLMAFDFKTRGYRALTAANGEDALRVVEGQAIDLVVSDVRMPGGDGVTLLRRILELPQPRPKVVLMTGYSDLAPELALAEGAAAVFPKPFDRPAFFAEVEKLLG